MDDISNQSATTMLTGARAAPEGARPRCHRDIKPESFDLHEAATLGGAWGSTRWF